MNSSGNRRVISLAAGSIAVSGTSWMANNNVNRRNNTSKMVDGLLPKNFGCCRCDNGIADIRNNNNTSPILPIRMIRPNPNLEIAFDTRTRTPIYVMERLTKSSLPERGSGGRRPNFYEEKSIEPSEFRSKHSHYFKSGWDRGHMAPRADFPSHLTQHTYTLANICPQDPIMNRGIWNNLEEWVRKLVHASENDTVDEAKNSSLVYYVITGPLWLPKRQIMEGKFEYQHLGLGRPPSLITVPTHFFKLVVVVDDDAVADTVINNDERNDNNNDTNNNPILRFACFVIGNEESCPSKKLEDYVVSWMDLETVTGLQFFPKWASREWKKNADKIMKFQVPASAGGNNSRLYLTDRSSSSSAKSGGSFSKLNDNFNNRPEHLCANQNCR